MGKIILFSKSYLIAAVILVITSLFYATLNAQSFSQNFINSKPLVGPAPLTVVQIPTLNGPTPLEVIGNPYSQPNIQEYLERGKLDWYGSGDVNDDGKVDSADIAIINSGAVPDSDLDRADVNGDGVVNNEDATTIQNYLNGTISYLPGYWNKLKTRDERVSWL